MSKDITTAGPSRRSIAKGAAWAVPAVSVAAAAPSLAASVIECTDCVTPLASASSITAPPNPATDATLLTAGVMGALITCSGLVSVGVATTQGARLTMSGSREDPNTPVTYEASTLGVGVAAGAFGVSAVAFASGFAFQDVTLPSGLYIGVVGLDSSPVRPTELCIDFSVPLNFGVGQEQTCEMTVCYTPTFVGATVGAVSAGGVITEPAIFPAIEWVTTWV